VVGLHWRAGHGPIGAEDTTVATPGLQFGTAAGALVEILASVGRHRFTFCGAAPRTGNDRLKDHNVQRSFTRDASSIALPCRFRIYLSGNDLSPTG
jgi:hypothetical protein